MVRNPSMHGSRVEASRRPWLAHWAAGALCLASGGGDVALAQVGDGDPVDPVPDTAAEHWSAETTWVLMVGLLEWENSHIYANMTKRARKDQALYETFLKRGVPKEQITYLQDQGASLANIEAAFSRLLSRTREGDTLVVYFTGHGTVDSEGNGYFVNYDAPAADDWSGLWRVSDIFGRIEEGFRGETVLLAAGCCFAGTLGDALASLDTKKRYACLASSLGGLESGGLWTFSESLISGLAGEAWVDTDGDGLVSLTELQRHSFEDVGVFMQQEASFAVNENFPDRFILSTAPSRKHPDVGKYFEILVDGAIDRKSAWSKARVCAVEDGKITFCYYPGELRAFTTLAAGSDRIRPIVRDVMEAGALVDVFYNYRWHPAHVVDVDAATGLHRIVYDEREGWDGLYFHDDLRLRSDRKDALRSHRQGKGESR